MTVEEIHRKTLSTKVSTPNAVYRIIAPCIARNYKDSRIYTFKKDDLVCVSGCGALHPSGKTAVFVEDYWVRVDNRMLEHYANPILQEAG